MGSTPTCLHAGCRIIPQYSGSWELYAQIVESFLSSSVDGEQCWIDHYYGCTGTGHEDEPFPPIDILWVSSGLGHGPVRNWYRNSLAGNDMNNFNNGVVAGAYWSVVGPGRNLQLAPTDAYYFRWDGSDQSGRMSLYDETQYPAPLPQPVKCVAPTYVEDVPGYILTCEESQNAVGYELLVGSDPYRVMDYQVISYTPAPPTEPTRILAFEGSWWTVRVRDEYGSTIYADPQQISPGLDIIDLSRNRKVDFKDFAILAQYGRQNEPSVDIAPAPIGDGKVDAKDVTVLAQYWLKEVLPASPVAYWKLDETEGGIAHDSIGGEDAFGPPDLLWRPEDGKVSGALELDGIDDLLFTTFSLNPADASFSVFAWVKGGAPGQVIISQAGGVDWLSAHPSEGKLMTELSSGGRFGGPLYSQTVITDGDWHCVGLTWDGSNRILYVDDVEAAKDTQAGLAGSNGGLYFGAGKDLAVGSLWSGLIDDIRIYDRAVTP